MKVDKKDEYFAFQSKLIRRVCMNVITSIVVVVGLYLFIWKQRIGDLIVWILETVFDMKHEAAFYYYSDHFRGNKEIFFAVAVLLIFTVLMVRIFRWVTGYFREVNQGIESLLADDEKQIQLSPEMLPFERKLNSVKQTLAERKMETALAEQRKDELVMYLAHDIRTPLTSVIGYFNLLEEDPNMPPEQRAARVHIVLEKAYRLETMVNEFFEITKYKSQKITLSKETIDLYNTSDTRGNSPSFGTNYQKTGKELMSRDELAVMDGSKCILQLRGVRPFLSDKFDITKHKRYKELSDFDKKNEFDVERYLKHELRLLTTEEFDLYEVDVTEQAQE